MRENHANHQSGSGMIELMVSLVLSLLVVLMTSSAFVQNKMTYLQNERFARLQESGRAALDLLARDLVMAGFWGDGVGDTPTAAAISLAADCGTNWALNAAMPVEYFRAANSTANPGSSFPCLQSVSGQYSVSPGTNALAVRRAAGSCVSTLASGGGAFVCRSQTSSAGDVYVRSDGTMGLSNGTAPAVERDWAYQVFLYYIGVGAKTGIPSLRRKTLRRSSGGLGMYEDVGGEFAEGVEYFHVEFGVDQTNPLGLALDGVPDCYLSTPSPAVCPGVAAAVGQVVSARIHVLVRSLEGDAFLVPDTKTYVLGGINVNTLLAGGGSFNDRFQRRVYSTTVQLRNPLYAALNSSGLRAAIR